MPLFRYRRDLRWRKESNGVSDYRLFDRLRRDERLETRDRNKRRKRRDERREGQRYKRAFLFFDHSSFESSSSFFFYEITRCERRRSQRERTLFLSLLRVRSFDSFVRSIRSRERERERIPRCLSPRPRAKRMREKDPSREVWRARLLLLQKIDDSGDDDERSTRGEIVPVVFRKDRTDARAEEVSELLVFFTRSVRRKVTIFVPRQKQNGLTKGS